MGIARRRRAPRTIDEYIDRCAPQAQPILRRVRATIAKAAPDATETISYGIPAFKLRRILVYFAAFKHHIGLYPPVKGDAALEKAVVPYAGEKGNLRFPIERKIPYALISRIVKFRASQTR
ncbi:MAG TPA: DUF1801 domain-containing protein [Vicinamibacterales bacterium]|nr:DUF1801 domain-containing protein [Vicinamibacterales bacterium]